MLANVYVLDRVYEAQDPFSWWVKFFENDMSLDEYKNNLFLRGEAWIYSSKIKVDGLRQLIKIEVI